MPGLFGMDTPEEVRARVGRTGREQDLQLAQLPVGRGQVALASQLGRGAAQGGAQLLGAPSPAQKQGQSRARISESIKSNASQMGITREDNPIEYLQLTSKVLLENGETQAAGNALKFAGEMDRMSRLESTALEKNIRQIHNLGKRDKLTPKARNMMSKILALQSTPSTSGVLPATNVASPTEFKGSTRFLKNALKGTETRFKDFDDQSNLKDFVQTHAEEVRTRLNENRLKGNPPLNVNVVRKDVLAEMEEFISEVGELQDIIPGRTNDVFFDFDAYVNREGQQPPTTQQGIGARQ